MARLTFEELAAMDGQLSLLLEEARHAGDGEAEFCANAQWGGWGAYHGNAFKSKITGTVGWNRGCGPIELQKSDAYDVVYQTLLHALPQCRGTCGCAEANQDVSPL